MASILSLLSVIAIWLTGILFPLELQGRQVNQCPLFASEQERIGVNVGVITASR